MPHGSPRKNLKSVTRKTSDRRDRLDSWKEIASYLGRSVRTVRRWEREEDLPVQRHQHAKGTTVFAFRAELDRWRESRIAGVRGPIAAPSQSSGGPDARPSGRNAILAVAAVAGVALLLSSLALYRNSSPGDAGDRWDEWVQRVPLHERLLFEAAYNQQRGDEAAALDSFKALLGLDAVDAPLVARMVESCQVVHEPAACADLLAEAADRIRPSQELQYKAARALALWAGDLNRAAAYSERSRRLMLVGRIDLDPEAFQFVQLFAARASWVQGNLELSLLELERLEPALPAWSEGRRDAVARAAGSHCLAMGRPDCAEAWFEHISAPEARHEALAMALFARGDSAALASHLDAGQEYREPFSAVLLAMTKRLDVAGRVAQQLTRRGEVGGSVLVAQGSVDLLSGKPDTGAELLRKGIDEIEAAGIHMHFVGLDMLSKVAQERGDLAGAVELLEMTSDLRTAAAFNGAGLFWIKCQERLAGLYTESGRVDEAIRVERQLLAMLALSDPGEPISAALKRRSS